MRKLFIFILAAAVFISCDNLRNNRNDKNNTDNKDNRYDNRNDNRDNRNDNQNNNNNNNRDNRNDNNTTDNNTNRNDNNYNNNNNNNNNNYNNGRWPSNDEDKFTNDCVRTATPNVGETRAKEYCSCMLGKIEKLYPTYDDAEKKMTQADMQPLADQCNGKGGNQNQYGNGN